MFFMYANAYDPGTPGVYRRRRTRRRSYRRIGYLAVLLLAILAAIRLVPYLETDTLGQVAALEESTTYLAPTIILDHTAPEILGVKDIQVYAGDTVSYRQGITVTDDVDTSVTLEVDASGVNLDTPGTYMVKYSATDAAGNKATAVAAVMVYEKSEDFQPMDAISAAAQSVIAQIITEDMTVQEQVEAIYYWAKGAFTYSGHSDRTDWRQTAYNMLTNGRGDCYGYFAATKLLFEELGIPNIDVQKVKNSSDDSDHFWSLVSVDGGETYYHFDCTPRIGQTEEFCLITDAALDTYSHDHKNSHNRDTSLYPATPEEAL